MIVKIPIFFIWDVSVYIRGQNWICGYVDNRNNKADRNIETSFKSPQYYSKEKIPSFFKRTGGWGFSYNVVENRMCLTFFQLTWKANWGLKWEWNSRPSSSCMCTVLPAFYTLLLSTFKLILRGLIRWCYCVPWSDLMTKFIFILL